MSDVAQSAVLGTTLQITFADISRVKMWIAGFGSTNSKFFNSLLMTVWRRRFVGSSPFTNRPPAGCKQIGQRRCILDMESGQKLFELLL